jgi:hypothetical protein
VQIRRKCVLVNIQTAIMEDIQMMQRNTQPIKTWKLSTGNAMMAITLNEEHLRLIKGGTVPNHPPDPPPLN